MQTHWSRYAPLCGPHARTFHSIRERNEKVETRDARGEKKRKKIGNADEIHCGFFIWRGIIFYPPFHPE